MKRPTAAPEDRDDAIRLLGQFIPLHYHHNMLLDEARMTAFRAAIAAVVRPGARVVELGGGTGVLSWFAAGAADRIWCVELNPELADEARRLLALNPGGEKVEVVEADAMEFLPPEPADLVICEMTHAALLREKQVAVLDSFRKRHLERFGLPLPTFLPEASILAVQPVEQDFDAHGYRAPIIHFQSPGRSADRSRGLAIPRVYHRLDYAVANDTGIDWRDEFIVDQRGRLNALRFLTRNLLALTGAEIIDWHNAEMILPLAEAIEVEVGDRIEIAFRYRAGGSIAELRESLAVRRPA